jgi:hypothetical protein
MCKSIPFVVSLLVALSVVLAACGPTASAGEMPIVAPNTGTGGTCSEKDGQIIRQIRRSLSHERS